MDNERKKIKYVMVGGIVLLVAIAAISIIILNIDTVQPLPKVKLAYSDLVIDEVLKKNLEEIENKLYDRIIIDYGDEISAQDMSCEIREGSVRSMSSDDGAVAFWFIVDISSLKQSYGVYFSRNEAKIESISQSEVLDFAGSNITFFCLSDGKNIMYPESSCMNNKPGSLYDEKDLYLYMAPYKEKLSGGNIATFTFRSGYKVDILLEACDNSLDLESIEKAKDWVESLSFDSEDFQYNVMIEYDGCLIK